LRFVEDGWRTVFSEAADLDKAVEMDRYPDRQDLNIDLLRIAKSTGVRIYFGPTRTGQLGFVLWSSPQLPPSSPVFRPDAF
jgi:hypothetical protein